MIEETIKIHDKFQFELKLNYKLEKDKKHAAYDIDAFIFLPKSLGINVHNYFKKNFYRNVHSYIRFKTPVFTLQNVLAAENSPHKKLQDSFKISVEMPDKTNFRKFEYQVKMFNSIFKSALRDAVLHLIRSVDEADYAYLVPNFSQQVKNIATAYRAIISPANNKELPEEILSYFQYGDEYLSLIIEKYYFLLLENFRKTKNTTVAEIQKELLQFIDDEIKYRKKNGYDSIPDKKGDNESLIFRFSILKKYIESVLFLDVSTKTEGKFIEQLVISLAAGLAMIFATAIAFIGQYKFGNYTFSFFLILVISYMFKDRIKELTRSFFKSKISKFLYDHKTKIYVGYKTKIGICRESFNFIRHRFLPDAIYEIRNRYRTREFANKFAKESIIHYRKHIELFPRYYKKIYHDYHIDGINDIIRFTIQPFLSKMDNPSKPIYVIDGEDYHKIFAKRVYHLNLIIKYTIGGQIDYQRFRIILSRKGIKRIEHVE